MDYDWYELNGGKLCFKADSFTENTFGKRFNRLSHEYMLISLASHGGPIAITSDKTKILTLPMAHCVWQQALSSLSSDDEEWSLSFEAALAQPMR